MNRVTLVGRLTRDPELRYTPSGVAVATFSLAVNRTFTNQSGEREADFVPCVVWRKQAENVSNYVHKGSLVGVDGRLQTRSYDAQDGSKRFVMEVVCDSVQFLEPKGSNAGGGNRDNAYDYGAPSYDAGPSSNNGGGAADSFEKPTQTFDISDDDLPF
nr:single-stranded DNA-binding protein [Culicoidibacter larvae]